MDQGACEVAIEDDVRNAFGDLPWRPRKTFSQFLVWDAAIIRFTLEAVFIFGFFQFILQVAIPEMYRGLYLSHIGLLAGIAAAVIFFDRVVLCRSLLNFDKSFQKGLEGKLDEAKELLENSKINLIPIPREIYLLRSIELNMMKELDDAAYSLIEESKNIGISKYDSELAKYRGILFSSWKEDRSLKIIDTEIAAHAEPLIQIERAMISLFREENVTTASRLSDLVSKLPPKMHISAASSYELAHLINLCAGLRQGKADIVLPQLSMLLDFIKFQIGNSPYLRPYLSFGYLERAKYYSRRSKTKNKAYNDAKLALAICSYPAHREIADKILASHSV